MKKLLVALLLLVSTVTANAQLSTAFTDRLQFVLDSVCTRLNIKGVSAALLVPGAGTWTGTHGESYAGHPITSDMLFGINSNTKTYISTLMLKLQELGYVSVDDTIGTWIHGQPNINGQITIKQLLNHTSGLYSFTDTAQFWDSVWNDPTRIWMPEDVLQFVYAPNFAPGASWSYSNTNYLVAGLIIKQIMGQPLSASLSNYIFSPAGLTNTVFFPEEAPTATVPHIWSVWFSGSYQEDVITTYAYSHNAMFSMSYGAGAIMSTAEDNASFWHQLISGQIIDTSSLNEMMQYIYVGNSLGHPVGYGLGIFRYQDMPLFSGHTIYEHGGTNMGFINENCVDSVTGVTISVLTNQDSLDNNMLFVYIMPALHNVSEQMPAVNKVPVQAGNKEIRIFPNPASDQLSVEIPGNTGQLKLSISDMSGRDLVSNALDGNALQIATSGLPEGSYVLTISSDKGTLKTQKVTIVH